jgi:type I restriction enzyme S subunit
VLIDTERKITPAGLDQISSGLLPVGTVLLSSRAPIGYLATAEVPLAINQGFIAMKCNRDLPNHFVLLWTRENMDAVYERANGTTFLEISKASFRLIPAIVPPHAILKRFEQMVGPLYKRLVGNVRQSRTLADLRDALLPRLLSGDLRVRDAEKCVETTR